MKKKAILVGTTSEIGHHGCTLVNNQIMELSKQSHIDVAKCLPLRAASGMLDFTDYDLVLVNGEGSLHNDSQSARWIAKIGATATQQTTPAFLFNTIYENNSREIADNVSKFTKVFVRDVFSLDTLRRAGISSKHVPDLSLSWQPAVTHSQNLPKTTVLTDSCLREVNTKFYSLAKKKNFVFLPLIAKPPLLASFPDKNIKRLSRYYLKRTISNFAMPGIWKSRYRNLIPHFDDCAQWLKSNTGLLVAGRFHAICIALNLEIPFVSVASNTKKVESLLEDLGLSERLVSNLNELDDALQNPKFLSFSEEETDKIRSYRHTTRENAQTMFEEIYHAA